MLNYSFSPCGKSALILLCALFFFAPTQGETTNASHSDIIKYRDSLLSRASELKKSDITLALHTAQKAIELEKNNHLKEDYNLHLLAGQILYKQKLYQQALQHFLILENRPEVMHDSLETIRMLNRIGSCSYRLDLYEKALENYLKLEDLSIKTKNNRYLSTSYMQLAFIYRDIEKQEVSKHYFRKLLSISKKLHNHIYQSVALNELGNHYHREKNISKAIEYHMLSYQLKKRSGDSVNLAYSCNDLATDYMQSEQYDKAIILLNKAIIYSKKFGNNTCHVVSLNNLALIAQEQKETHKALNYLKEAWELSKSYNVPSRRAYTALNLSHLYKSMKQPTKALYYLEQYTQLHDTLLNEESAKELTKQQILHQTERHKRNALFFQQQNNIQKMKLHSNRLWIYSLLIVFVLLVIIGRVIIQRNNIRKDQQLAEQRLKALNLQMNPHFLFNTLNSIQRFILANEKQTSSNYLTKFSRLMRMVLDSSDKDLIPLKNDMEALRKYLEMEQIRFGYDFKVILNTSSQQLEDYLVPPLLIQPLAENAIKHGLRHLTEKNTGILSIKWEEQKDLLICTISDNGIGFKESQEIQKNATIKHISKGLEITKNRLTLLQKIYNKSAFMNISGCKDKNGNPCGTTIQITLPVIRA